MAMASASDCEGAGEMFRVTTLDLDNVPKNEDGTVDYTLSLIHILMSQTTFLQKESIPAIAHLVELRGPECTARG